MVCLTWLSMKGEYYFLIMYSCCSSKTEKTFDQILEHILEMNYKYKVILGIQETYIYLSLRFFIILYLKSYLSSNSFLIIIYQFIIIFSYSCNELRNTHFVALYVGKLLEKIYLFPAYLKKRFLSWR